MNLNLLDLIAKRPPTYRDLIPRPLRSTEDLLRLEHRDLPDLDDCELRTEQAAVRNALARQHTQRRARPWVAIVPANGVYVEPVLWLRRRDIELTRELARRRRAAGGNVRSATALVAGGAA